MDIFGFVTILTAFLVERRRQTGIVRLGKVLMFQGANDN
jgi:hypothetical protein